MKTKWTLIAGVLLVLVAMLWSWKSYQKALHDSVVQEAAVTIEIPKGASFKQIVSRLETQQISIQPLWFRLIAYQFKLAGKLQAGEYEIKPGSTMHDMLQQFAEGRVKQYNLTFPEGWCFREMLELLSKAPGLQHTLDSHDVKAALTFLAINDMQSAEGWFFPDTYSYIKDTSDIAILKRAYQKQQEVLQQEWQQKQADLPLATAYQALILASIIEKETALASERPQIAGVFVRRLQKGMLLQTDPTVIYGMGAAYKGNIRRKDLTTATPYNTYMIAGLPPTPIAMPGREAIHAALHPAAGSTLYFVARGDGSHEFSNSLEIHTQAVKKYQLKHS